MTRILIIKPSSLGDVIHTFPSVELLRQLHDVELHWVINDNLREIVTLMPGVARLISFPRKRLGRFSLPALHEFIRELRRDRYDLAIDYQGLLRSGLLTFLARADEKIGFTDAREGAPFFYNRHVTVPTGLTHAIDKNLYLTRQATGLEESTVRLPDLQVPDNWLALADRLLPVGAGPLLAIGYSSRWPSKNWSPGFFAAVISAVAVQVPGLRCWLLGTPEERAAGERLLELLPAGTAINLAGQSTLPGLAGMLRRSQALLTNDSGPMHIAAALKVPCVALFGATDDRMTGPYGSAECQHQIFRTLCLQSPCFRHDCPRGGDLCHRGIDPAAVAAALVARLSSHPG